MGQRLSTLKLILKQKNIKMDDNKVTLINKENETEPIDNELKTNDENPENHQHFENIYNTSCEQLNETAEVAITTDMPQNNDNDETPKNTEELKNDVTEKKRTSRKKHHHDSHKKKKNHWVLKFNCARLKSGSSSNACSELDIPGKSQETDCVCTGYRRTENTPLNTEDLPTGLPIFIPKQHLEQLQKQDEEESSTNEVDDATAQSTEPVIDLSKFNPEDYPIEDCDERARLERAREIAEGVDPPPGFSPKRAIQLVCHPDLTIDKLTDLFQNALSLSALSEIDVPRSVHTRIDYIHCLVPDLLQIVSSSFYWGKMDRYEAERLLDNKPEGTFLLRDSAQEEYLFSVSFRKYDRSLHARIEQWNHLFSFDSHDPGVFSSPTVCGLIEHYKDPTTCMFFEPMLTIPLHRNFPFSLQHICRAVICDKLEYDQINYLKLPKTLKSFLKEYHYKQRVRVKKYDGEQ